MNKQEAAELVEAELRTFRSQPYDELLRLRTEIMTYTVSGPSGTAYGVEVQAFWDSGRPGNLRVTAAIDDGGISAFRPLCRDFVVAPDGRFIGE